MNFGLALPAELLYPGVAHSVFGTGFAIDEVGIVDHGIYIKKADIVALIPRALLVDVLASSDYRRFRQYVTCVARELAA